RERSGAKEALPRCVLVRARRCNVRDNRGLLIAGRFSSETNRGSHCRLSAIGADDELRFQYAARRLDLHIVLADREPFEAGFGDLRACALRCFEQRVWDEPCFDDVAEIGLADFGRVEREGLWRRWSDALVPDAHSFVGAHALCWDAAPCVCGPKD